MKFKTISTVKEASQYLDVTMRHVRGLVASGELRTITVGQRKYITRKSLRAVYIKLHGDAA